MPGVVFRAIRAHGARYIYFNSRANIDMNKELDMLFIFLVVAVTGHIARRAVKVAFRPKFHLSLLCTIIFVIAFLHSSISYQLPLIEKIWRACAVAATSVVCFYYSSISC